MAQAIWPKQKLKMRKNGHYGGRCQGEYFMNRRNLLKSLGAAGLASIFLKADEGASQTYARATTGLPSTFPTTSFFLTRSPSSLMM